MTPDEEDIKITAAAIADPDNPPLTDKELAEMASSARGERPAITGDSEKPEPAPLSPGHQAEILDRVLVLASMHDHHILWHPFITTHPNLRERCDKIAEALGDLYQAIGGTCKD